MLKLLLVLLPLFAHGFAPAPAFFASPLLASPGRASLSGSSSNSRPLFMAVEIEDDDTVPMEKSKLGFDDAAVAAMTEEGEPPARRYV